MPEVVGDAGVLVSSQDPAAVAEGIAKALDAGPDGARRARERIVTTFPLQIRRDGILAVVQETLQAR